VSEPVATVPALAEGPDHYRQMPIQPVVFAHRNRLGFIEGSVVKYVCRWRLKGGLADLEKARHFIDLLIQLETDPARRHQGGVVAGAATALPPAPGATP